MSSGVMVTVAHLREAKLCSRGAKQWFDRNGMDFKAFLIEGLPVETVEAIGDSLGALVAKIARDEAAEELK